MVMVALEVVAEPLHWLASEFAEVLGEDYKRRLGDLRGDVSVVGNDWC